MNYKLVLRGMTLWALGASNASFGEPLGWVGTVLLLSFGFWFITSGFRSIENG